MIKTKWILKLACVLILGSTLVLPVSAQDKTAAAKSVAVKLSVGDPSVDGSALQPYTNLWRLNITDKSGKTVSAGAWTDDMRWVDVGGRKLLRRAQIAAVTIPGGRVTQTINVFDPKTLAPVRTETRALDGSYHINEFDGTKIKRKILDLHKGSTPAEDTVNVDVPVFDFYGGMYGLLLVNMPLKEGYTATIPTAEEDTDAFAWVTFTVTGREKVNAGAGKQVDAWVVEASTSFGPMKFWLTKEAPYIIRLTYTGPNGNLWSYDMA